MKTGGTQAPVRRKTSGFKVGDTVVCIGPKTIFYKKDEEYEVVSHPEYGNPCIQCRDGLYDMMSMVSSTFEKKVVDES